MLLASPARAAIARAARNVVQPRSRSRQGWDRLREGVRPPRVRAVDRAAQVRRSGTNGRPASGAGEKTICREPRDRQPFVGCRSGSLVANEPAVKVLGPAETALGL